jgi:predicted ATPase
MRAKNKNGSAIVADYWSFCVRSPPVFCPPQINTIITVSFAAMTRDIRRKVGMLQILFNPCLGILSNIQSNGSPANTRPKYPMIKSLTVENFKSIDKLDIEFGRITVLIGENGSGKSNILEAIALAGAAVADKLDNEFLASRGIRVTNPEVMRAAFLAENISKNIKFGVALNDGDNTIFELENDNELYSTWHLVDLESSSTLSTLAKGLASEIKKLNKLIGLSESSSESDALKSNQILKSELMKKESFLEAMLEVGKFVDGKKFALWIKFNFFQDFLIYAPENSALRKFEEEGQIQPLGIRGEGLFKLLGVLSKDTEAFPAIKTGLQVLGWFKDFKLSDNNHPDRKIQLEDKYLSPEINLLDQKSANEGFLFLLFYLALFTSKNTPKFFAIDNIEASFNPKLCEKLMQELTQLAKQFDKQVIFTTHNPSILDGLNLDDPEQILYVVNRTPDGYTKLKRIQKPKAIADTKPTKLSAAFLNGYLGGLPKGF